jgi:hypothetical protein
MAYHSACLPVLPDSFGDAGGRWRLPVSTVRDQDDGNPALGAERETLRALAHETLPALAHVTGAIQT